MYVYIVQMAWIFPSISNPRWDSIWNCENVAAAAPMGFSIQGLQKWDPHPIASLNFQILPCHGGFLWEWNGEPAGMRLISWRIPENYINWPFHLLYPSAICRKNVILVNFFYVVLVYLDQLCNLGTFPSIIPTRYLQQSLLPKASFFCGIYYKYSTSTIRPMEKQAKNL